MPHGFIISSCQNCQLAGWERCYNNYHTPPEMPSKVPQSIGHCYRIRTLPRYYEYRLSSPKLLNMASCLSTGSLLQVDLRDIVLSFCFNFGAVLPQIRVV